MRRSLIRSSAIIATIATVGVIKSRRAMILVMRRWRRWMAKGRTDATLALVGATRLLLMVMIIIRSRSKGTGLQSWLKLLLLLLMTWVISCSRLIMVMMMMMLIGRVRKERRHLIGGCEIRRSKVMSRK